MYLALHRFVLAPYRGLVVATGLPRPSAMSRTWDDMFLDFDENLYKQINDENATRVPGRAEVLPGAEGALRLEMARSHCLRRCEKIFQGSLSLGICASLETGDAPAALFLPHPAMSFAYFDARGNLNELIVRASEPRLAWGRSECHRDWQWCLGFRGVASRQVPLQELEVSENRCLRIAQLLDSQESEKVFSFSLAAGGSGGI